MVNPAKELNETWQQASNENVLLLFLNLFFIVICCYHLGCSYKQSQRRAEGGMGKERKKLAGQEALASPLWSFAQNY